QSGTCISTHACVNKVDVHRGKCLAPIPLHLLSETVPRKDYDWRWRGRRRIIRAPAAASSFNAKKSDYPDKSVHYVTEKSDFHLPHIVAHGGRYFSCGIFCPVSVETLRFIS